MRLGTTFKVIIFFIIGVLLGYIIMYVSHEVSTEARELADVPRARFGAQQKIPVGERIRNDDFYTRIDSGKCDFAKELALILEEGKTQNSSPNWYKAYYLLSKWGNKSPHVALAALDSVPFQYRNQFKDYIFEGWADKAPEELAHYFTDNKEELYPTGALSIAMERWGRISPINALQFLTTLNFKEQEVGLSYLIESAQFEVSTFQKMAQMMPDRQLNNEETLLPFMHKWFSNDPLTATQWMESLSPEQQKILERFQGWNETFPSLNEIVEQSKQGPESVQKAIAILPHNLQIEAWSKVLDEICMEKGTEEMIKWSAALPIEIAKEIYENPYFSGPINTISRDNIKDFEEFLSAIPEDHRNENPLIARAFNQFSNRFAYRYPEETVSFLSKFYGGISSSYGIFRYEDPEAAKRWLDNSSIPGYARGSLEKSRFHNPAGAIKKK